MEGSSLYKMLNTVSKSTRQRVFAWQNRYVQRPHAGCLLRCVAGPAPAVYA
jgi:hypothetical protein